MWHRIWSAKPVPHLSLHVRPALMLPIPSQTVADFLKSVF